MKRKVTLSTCQLSDSSRQGLNVYLHLAAETWAH